MLTKAVLVELMIIAALVQTIQCGNKQKNVGGLILSEFKKLKLNVDIPPVHIFDIMISPKLHEKLIIKSTNIMVSMECAGSYIYEK